VGSLGCNSLVDSLAKAAQVVKCHTCDTENATMHCVECGENLGASCSGVHKRSKASSHHQQIPLHSTVASCQNHPGTELDTYCKKCCEVVCTKCMGERQHSRHVSCPLGQMTGALQDEIAGFVVGIRKKEKEAKKTVTALDGTIAEISKKNNTAEEGIRAYAEALQADLDHYVASLRSKLSTQQALLNKTVATERERAKAAAVEFREFCTFTEGLLAKGTPAQIALSHSTVRAIVVSNCLPALILKHCWATTIGESQKRRSGGPPCCQSPHSASPEFFGTSRKQATLFWSQDCCSLQKSALQGHQRRGIPTFHKESLWQDLHLRVFPLRHD